MKFFNLSIFQSFNRNKGQSLIEIIISLTIGAILIAAAAAAIIPTLRSSLESQNVQTANSLTQEYLDAIQNLSESNWFNIYNPPGLKGPNSQFHLGMSGTAYQIFSGATSTTIGNQTFTRYFSIENVARDSCGIGNVTTSATTTCPGGPATSGVFNDPSTEKITVTVSWPTNRLISRAEYLTRSQNKVFNQSDWSAGPGQEGPITSENSGFSSSNNINYSTSSGSIIIQGF